MSQISSAYPTAGGLYHWGSILGNRGTGWVTAWLNLLGLITVLGAINVGTWTFFMGSFGAALGIENTITTQTIFLIIITGGQALINHMGIRLTAKLTDFSGWLIFGGSILIAVVCLLAADSWDFGRLFTFKNYSGEAGGNVWPAVSNGWVFALGLLLPIYTITGYDASAHTSEETLKAAHSVPRAMVMSVIWSALFGYLFLARLRADDPRHGPGGGAGLERLLLGLRPAGEPGREVARLPRRLRRAAPLRSGDRHLGLAHDLRLLARRRPARLVGARQGQPDLPHAGGGDLDRAVLAVLFVWGSSLVSVAGTSAYTIVVSCTVIFLFLSFTIPIVLGLLAWGTPKWDKMGPWDLGRGVFTLFAVLSVISMVLIFVIGIQPPNDWALYITVGFFILTAIVWFAFEKRRFQGPPLGDLIAKRQAVIRAAERAVGETG